MLTPAELRPEMTVRGLAAGGAAEVVGVKTSAAGTVTVTYEADGQLDKRVFYPDSDVRLEPVGDDGGWTFNADPAAFLLAAEAERIGLAWLFDPYLAVHCSLIQALPHQITAVYQEMLPRQPLRFVLADDPGAGKTIMTGLFIRELIARGDLRRCLVVSPGSLTEQWRDELHEKFSLKFALHPGSAEDEPDWFDRHPLAIARLDRLARNEDLQARLERVDWDLVVFDEAHKLSATYFGAEAKYTKRYNFAQRIGPATRHLLLLTATPHNGKEDDFRLFLRLVDPDRFEGKARGGDEANSGRAAAKDLMRRLLKEDLRKFDGSPLFPPRKCYSVAYELSPAEADLYDRVTEYVRQEFNRAERALPDGKARAAVGFALTILQRRLASSPAAIAKSLTRRRERLEATLAEVEEAERTGVMATAAVSRDAAAGRLFGIDLDDPDLPDDYDEQPDDLPDDELETLEGHLIDRASAARSAVELRAEIAALRDLEAVATGVRAQGTDTKWEELRGLLQEDEHMRSPSGRRRKLVIFTEHRDTLDYLVAQLTTLLGRSEAVVTIHGGMDRKARLISQERFNNDPTAEVLVATDAAGEGINLQRASHLMVNYDLPWNPNRLEQRFGRIHRIGQAETCHLWNLVAEGTREGDVYQRLLEKLTVAGNDLDGKIFNVLDRLRYDGRSLRQLMIEAVKTADDPAAPETIRAAIDRPFDSEQARALIRDHALGDDRLDMAQVRAVRAEMERADARRLQPHYVADFFKAAFERLGGKLRPRETHRFEIKQVPQAVREEAAARTGSPLPPAYERVTFHRDATALKDQPTADLLTPGHPLLEAVLALTAVENRDALAAGAVLVDDRKLDGEPRVLALLDHAVRDGREDARGERRVISRRVLFVELLPDGSALDAGFAPYLDFRAAMPEERDRAFALPAVAACRDGAERRAVDMAVEGPARAHLEEVRDRRVDWVERTRDAVHKRLTWEIMHWDGQAARLRRQVEDGTGRANAASLASRYANRAADLKGRLAARMKELDLEAQVDQRPPRVVAAALIVPAGLVAPAPPDPITVRDTRTSELAAMAAVTAAEEALGFTVEDVSKRNGLGYDLESTDPATGGRRFLEVKGLRPGAELVTLMRSEVIASLNRPDLWRLAMVEVSVDGAGAATAGEPLYVRGPVDAAPPSDHAASVNYSAAKFRARGVPAAESL